MCCWISIFGVLLIMMGSHARSEALFYYFRLEDAVFLEYVHGPRTHQCSFVKGNNPSQRASLSRNANS
jgi:hypothetical protein